MSSATNLLAKGQDARLRQRSGMSLERQGCRLGEVFDDLDQFVRAVTVLATEFDELACLRHDDTALGCSRHGDASTATELEKSFLPKELQRTQQGVLVHPEDGGIVFTDPGYGSHWWYEGNVRELELPTSVYHLDAQSGNLTRLTDEIFKPNGLCFSADYRTLYVADSAPTHHPEKGKIIAWDVQDNGRRLTNRREFAVLEALMREPGAVVSSANLEDSVYGWGEEVGSNSVEVHLHHLRRKLDPALIRNVRGVGYRIVPLQ